MEKERRLSEEEEKLLAWFIGPKSENASFLEEMLLLVLRDYLHWRKNYFPTDSMLISNRRELELEHSLIHTNLEHLLAELRRNFPFYSPRYLAHMLSDTLLTSILGYIAGLLYNPNNITPEAAPVTVNMEIRACNRLLRMLGFNPPPDIPKEFSEEAITKYKKNLQAQFGWAHLTSGGTTANMEAIFVAKSVRYLPLAIQDVAVKEKLDIELKLPKQGVVDVKKIDRYQLLLIKPNEAIYLLGKYTQAYLQRHNYPLDSVVGQEKASDRLRESEYHVANGVGRLFSEFPPVIFVSGAAHYCIDKIADILGIGRRNVEIVSITQQFRMDVSNLEQKLESALYRRKVPLAVIPTVGTTEEGAVDPVHKIVELRERFEREKNASFWIHVDAAWGGYIRAIFSPSDEARERGLGTRKKGQQSLDELSDEITEYTRERITLEYQNYAKKIDIGWGNRDVHAAFLAISKADSVTIDPHKMGYINYPCGMVAFKNDRVRHFILQKTPYITSVRQDVLIHMPPEHIVETDDGTKVVTEAFAPFIVEGSRPGAAASALWLTVETVPPTREGAGLIIKSSLLAARELYEWLVHWETIMRCHQRDTDYQFIPLTVPDTNIVIFTVKKKTSNSLSKMNELTRLVYESFTIQAELGEKEYSYSQPFFLSKTVFRESRYPFDAFEDVLDRHFANLDMIRRQYKDKGLTVLRATVMNPYLRIARCTSSQHFIREFMEELSKAASENVRRIN
jgi:glutamate/tyrosine decarboxylase-like PLP-dependent enzyme